MLPIIITAFVILAIIFAVVIGLNAVSTQKSPRSRARTCPVCNAKLQNSDRVFADELKRSGGPSELKIKGCTYCYEDET